MSAQGGTLQRRGTIELPIWPVAVLVVTAVAAAIGMTLLTSAEQTTVSEQGATLPAIVGISHATPRLSAPTSVGYVGLENAGSYLPQAAYSSGLENPTAYVPGEVAPTVAGPATGRSTGITVDGVMCHQCR